MERRYTRRNNRRKREWTASALASRRPEKWEPCARRGVAAIANSVRRTRKSPKRQSSDDTLAALEEQRSANSGQYREAPLHRHLGCRGARPDPVSSWSVNPNAWYRTFLDEPRGTIEPRDRKIGVRSIPIKSETLRDAIDRAYLVK